MKAAVIHQLGVPPTYEDFPDPVVEDGEVPVKVMVVILDYLWGHPAEVIINSFTPKEISAPGRRTRFVLIGGLAGWTAQLSGQSLLTSGLEIYGMMGAQTPPEAMAEGTRLVWDLIRQGKLKMDVVKVPLKDIEKAWDMQEHGKRIVVVP